MIDWEKNVLAPCQGVFGEPATYTPAGGSPTSVSVIFDSAYMEVSMSEYGVEKTTARPVAGVNLGDFGIPPAQGDQLLRIGTGKTYQVREVRPDSHGSALLMLNYVSG